MKTKEKRIDFLEIHWPSEADNERTRGDDVGERAVERGNENVEEPQTKRSEDQYEETTQKPVKEETTQKLIKKFNEINSTREAKIELGLQHELKIFVNEANKEPEVKHKLEPEDEHKQPHPEARHMSHPKTAFYQMLLFMFELPKMASSSNVNISSSVIADGTHPPVDNQKSHPKATFSYSMPTLPKLNELTMVQIMCGIASTISLRMGVGAAIYFL